MSTPGLNPLIHFASGSSGTIAESVIQVPADSPEECVAVLFGDETHLEFPPLEPAAALLELLQQCRRATESGLFYVSLMSALIVPSICGALGSEKGKGTGSNYRQWLVDEAGYANELATSIYHLRCSLLHEGSSLPHHEESSIAFIESTYPGFPELHLSVTDVRGEVVRWISVPRFIDELDRGTQSWLGKYGATERVQRNLIKFAHRRPMGYFPHVVGTPVVI